jgi:type IV secretion system protein VirB1
VAALPIAVVAQLALACAPNVAVDTTLAIAHHESNLNPLAIYDNTARRAYVPGSPEEALAIARGLIDSKHSVDLGLMQINSGNLAWLSLPIEAAFDPCRSIAAGARVLSEAYRGGGTQDEQRRALEAALSRYNTGNPADGFTNGYVRKVQASGDKIVPSLHPEWLAQQQNPDRQPVDVWDRRDEVPTPPPAPPAATPQAAPTPEPPTPPPPTPIRPRQPFIKGEHSDLIRP